MTTTTAANGKATASALRRISLFGLLGAALLASLLLSAVPARAGGWATVTTVSPLDDVRAGEETTIVLEVKQHGQTLIDWEKPTLSAINTATGERVNATGVASKQLGQYLVQVTFPTTGEWSWAVTLAQLALVDSTFAPITVGEAGAAGATTGAKTDANASTAGGTAEEVANLTVQLSTLQTTVGIMQADLSAAVADNDALRSQVATLRSDADATAQTTRWLQAGLVIVSALLVAVVAAGALLLRRNAHVGSVSSTETPGTPREPVLAD